MLQQDAALALHDRFGQAGGARGIEYPEWMLERDLLEGEGGWLGEQAAPGNGLAEAGAGLLGGSVQVRNDDGMFECRQGCLKLGQHSPAVEGAPIVLVAIDGEEHPWLNLPKTVNDAAGAEVGRAARPDSAKAGAGEEGDHCLRDIR